MKVIFLDIDGVLNNEAWLRNLDLDKWSDLKYQGSALSCHREFDPENVKWFKHIVDNTGASIVISSSWQQEAVEPVKALGVDVLGVTGVGLYGQARKWEIIRWVNTNKPDKWCAIDDEKMKIAGQYFIRTSFKYGLLEPRAKQAIKILNS